MMENITKIPIDRDILKLHILYLEKIEKMSDEERDCFTKYFYFLSNPQFFVEVGPA